MKMLYSTLLFTFFYQSTIATALTYNVVNLGAKGDGKTDSTKYFLSAWASACASTSPATIYVPKGNYLLTKADFQSENCKNDAIAMRIDGTLMAPSDYDGNAGNWIKFEGVSVVSIYGGVLDGRGTSLWACNASSKTCPTGATAPEPQTYGSRTSTAALAMELGWDLKEPGVQNVTVKTVTFTDTTNGVRIKTWGRPSNGFVKGVVFQHLLMDNVKNPIIIDQNYCPDNKDCPGQNSGVKIDDVTYQDIHGTSGTKVAVKFDCSKTNPCSGIRLEEVNLSYKDQPAEVFMH
ncbi:pectin lyase-like superfamily protein [Actinidia rufa]|uniref:Pectin lyase-like superfamily protein n=1 Tax=Actinidia rufa TaxID=165716 RepID=A0A7J0GIP0_9ERIC|nr:pectin lyase-like superfamily protein [Actinidia rufa]